MKVNDCDLRYDEHHHNYPMIAKNRVNDLPEEYEKKLDYDRKQVLAVQRRSHGIPFTLVSGYVMDYQPKRLELADEIKVSLIRGVPLGDRGCLKEMLRDNKFKGEFKFRE